MKKEDVCRCKPPKDYIMYRCRHRKVWVNDPPAKKKAKR